MNKFFAFLKIIRPLNIFQSAIAVLITATLVSNFPAVMPLLLTMITIGSFIGAGNTINDYFDFDTDRTNRPDRPLPAGALTKPAVLIITLILFLAGILAFFPVATRLSTIILVINFILLIIYTPLLKPTSILGNVTVSYLLGSSFLFAAEIFGDYTAGIIPALLAFLFNVSRELVKDMEDIKGDAENNIKTLPVKYGLTFSKGLAFFLILLIIAFCWLPYSLGIYGIYYLISVIITVEIPLLLVLYLLLISKRKNDYSRIANIMKILVFCGLLSIYLGKY